MENNIVAEEKNKKDKKENNEKIKENKYPKTHEQCGCTKEDFVGSLKYLSREELQNLKMQGYVEAICDECGTEYRVENEELDEVIKNIIDEDLEPGEACKTCFLDCDIK